VHLQGVEVVVVVVHRNKEWCQEGTSLCAAFRSKSAQKKSCSALLPVTVVILAAMINMHSRRQLCSCASTSTPVVGRLLHMTPEACSTKSRSLDGGHPECRRAWSRLMSSKQRIHAVAHTCGEGTAERYTCWARNTSHHSSAHTPSGPAWFITPGVPRPSVMFHQRYDPLLTQFGKHAVYLWTAASAAQG